MATPTGPLTGYRVLDLGGPLSLHCTKLLADMGADVIKIEAPSGDESRRVPPFKDDTPHLEKSLYFLHFNTNKRGITLDVEKPDGRAIVLELCKKADVIIETFRPSRAKELRLTYEDLSAVNPALIVASITPFGQNGPWKDYKANDMAGIALGNLLYLAGEPGEPPLQPPGEIAYGMASTYGAFGIAVALYHRLDSGKGQHIDVSMHECAGHIAGYFIPNYGYTGDKPARASRKGEETDLYDPYQDQKWLRAHFHHPRRAMAPSGRVDGQSAVDLRTGVRKDGLPAQTSRNRRRRRSPSSARSHTKEELYEEGQKRRIAVTPINTAGEFVEMEQTKARGLFVDMDHPVVGKYKQFGPVPRLMETPGNIYRPAPLLGEHNQEIYVGDLGMNSDDLVALQAEGVI